MDVDAAADELYGLTPKEFTSRRDALVKEAKATGDRETATAIAALRRPTMVGWVANQLSRAHPEEITPLLDLGEALREATATLSGPELRQLSAQRQRLVTALVQQARALARDRGERVSEDVARGLEETLNAALADPDAGSRLVEARLTDGLTHEGFGSAPSSPGSRPPKAPGPSGATEKKAAATRTGPSAEERRRQERRARLERDLGDAWGQARRAAEARDGAVAEADRTRRERADAEREMTRLRSELTAAEEAVRTATKQDEHAQSARERAEAEAQRARQRVTDLQSRLDEL